MDRQAPTLEVAAVQRTLGRLPVLRGVSLTISPGELFGLLGANGAGKTTLIRVILGLLRADSGRIRIQGRDLGSARPELLRRVGAMLEQPRMIPELTLDENLRIFAALLRLSNPREQITATLAEVGLSAWRHIPMRRFSKGMQQKAALSRALIHDPPLLILDEPFAGLDPLFQEEFRRILAALRGRGCAILISMHNLSEIERLCTHLGVLRHGRLALDGDLQTLRRSCGRRRLRFTWRRRMEADAARALLAHRFRLAAHAADPTSVVLLVGEAEDPHEISRLLAAAGRSPCAVRPEDLTIEEICYDVLSGKADADLSPRSPMESANRREV